MHPGSPAVQAGLCRGPLQPGGRPAGLDKLQEAEACFRQAVYLKPDYFEAYKNLGVVLRLQNKHAEAVANLQKALDLKPDYADAANNLEIARQKLAEHDQFLASLPAPAAPLQNAGTLDNVRLTQLGKSYLAGEGWFASLAGEPKDGHGDAVPWITYPATAMLRRIVRPDFKIFEYGCGSSTVWWSKRAQQVVSVDHDLQWIEKIRPTLPDGVDVRHRPVHSPLDGAQQNLVDEFFGQGYELPTSGNPAHDMQHGFLCREFAAYACELLQFPQGHFNIVVVDGMARTLTAWLAARQLGEDGIMLFDNTDRWQYNSAYKFLTEAGFAKIDFWGVGPMNTYPWCTSLFIKNIEAFRHNVIIDQGTKADLGW